VLDEAVEEKAGGEKVRIGMVVCLLTDAMEIGFMTDALCVCRSFGEIQWLCLRYVMFHCGPSLSRNSGLTVRSVVGSGADWW